MARSKKADEQKQLAPAVQPHLQQPINGPGPAPIMAPAPATPFSNQQGRVIDVTNFIRVRDSVRAARCFSLPPLPIFRPCVEPDGGDAVCSSRNTPHQHHRSTLTNLPPAPVAPAVLTVSPHHRQHTPSTIPNQPFLFTSPYLTLYYPDNVSLSRCPHFHIKCTLRSHLPSSK